MRKIVLLFLCFFAYLSNTFATLDTYLVEDSWFIRNTNTSITLTDSDNRINNELFITNVSPSWWEPNNIILDTSWGLKMYRTTWTLFDDLSSNSPTWYLNIFTVWSFTFYTISWGTAEGSYSYTLSSPSESLYQELFYCTEEDEDLVIDIVTGELSCEAWGQWWDIIGLLWDLVDALVDFFNWFFELFEFSTSWIGFGFDVDSLWNFITINYGFQNTTTINNATCGTMIFSELVASSFNAYYDCWPSSNEQHASFNNFSWSTLLYVTPWASIRGNFTSCDYRNTWSFWVTGLPYVRASSVWCSFWDPMTSCQWYWNSTSTFNSSFTYINPPEYNLITINTDLFDSLNLLPFTLVLFWLDVVEVINDSIAWLFSLTLNIIAIPADLLNSIVNIIWILNINIWSEESFCFWGNRYHIIGNLNTGTRINSTISSINSYTGSIINFNTDPALWSNYLYYFLILWCSYIAYRRIKTIF